MPCYEYHCEYCGKRFERIKPVQHRERDKCPCCGTIVKVGVSVPCMQPDTYWSGHVDDTFGYVTSKKQLRELEAQAGFRRKDKGDGANARIARGYREHKEDVLREKSIGETVRDVLA